MYNNYNNYQCPNYMNRPWYNRNMIYDYPRMYPRQYYNNPWDRPDYINMYTDQYPYSHEDSIYNPWSLQYPKENGFMELIDYGPNPFAINIEKATKQNEAFRTALWTGEHLQLTLMSLNPNEDIGLEMHPNDDQFIRIEEGRGIVQMGDSEDNLDFEEMVVDDFIFIIPAGKWHNLTNIGNTPLKLYSIYAPPNHPYGTVHETKAEAEAAEHHH